ncbi:IclR family transcriptional regulator [Amycolatopsis acidiphila]|uniref:IclR family transcriptional regulator n=1 Tax=Amycolatopsis acidiphila TaxID=715473 RepID=A0A558A5G5_9PSEU|nr:IclR family transcriptional regulator [Amycolatopsis acidiphila]TVT19519.1 IclR family transcriptional regulator [Amycolatopsis acidiphila]UIJ56890.1 IclR family transcriptional regulator [Amycolatopsis acidiphila]GHG54539.1 IclR family transcriptional regulator [Amycolatopsis acidiphila]
MTKSRTEPALSSVDNALQLVRLLAQHRALRLSEVADLLGVAPSTAHRLLNSLRTQGFAEQRSRNGPYCPGPVLEELGLASLNRMDVRQVVRPMLEQLWTATGETVSLGVLEGRHIRFVDGIEGNRTVRVGNRTGVLIPAHCTAAGKAIMAVLSEVEFDRRFAGRSLERRTTASISGWPQLTRELAAIRKAGFAMNVEEGENGVSAVGAAVRDLMGAPVASINVVLPSSRMGTKRVGRELAGSVLEAVAAASAALRDAG